MRIRRSLLLLAIIATLPAVAQTSPQGLRYHTLTPFAALTTRVSTGIPSRAIALCIYGFKARVVSRTTGPLLPSRPTCRSHFGGALST
jgi:hypothetical protein